MLVENLVTEENAQIMSIVSLELSQISEGLKTKTGLTREGFLTALGKVPESVTDLEFMKLAKKVGIEPMPTIVFKKRFLNVKVSNILGEIPRLKKGKEYLPIMFDSLSNSLVLESTDLSHKVSIGLGKELISSTEKLTQVFGRFWSDTKPSEKASLTKTRNESFGKRSKESLLHQYGANLPKVIENRQIGSALRKGNFASETKSLGNLDNLSNKLSENYKEYCSLILGKLGYGLTQDEIDSIVVNLRKYENLGFNTESIKNKVLGLETNQGKKGLKPKLEIGTMPEWVK